MLDSRLSQEQLQRVGYLESYRADMVQKYETDPIRHDDYIAIIEAIDERIVHIKMGWA